jgi:lipid-A-disaccharide synthase
MRLALVDTYAMVNLIAGDRVVVELIQDACTAGAVTDEAVRLLNDRPYREQMIASLENVKLKLGGPGASDRAAAAILDLVPQVP